MSLFFEDEIQKAKEKTDRLGLDDLMSQDPRDNPGRVNSYRNTSRNQSSPSRDKHGPGKRPSGRRK